ncbi:hypothetical protein D3C87_1673960 [compost metagenome]
MQLRFRDDRTGMLDQLFQHGPFSGAERLRCSVNDDIARHLVDFDAGQANDGGGAPLVTPRDRQHACRKLVEIEGLDQIVVRSGIQSGNPVGHLVVRRQNDHRRRVVSVAQ